jgi:polyisoprenoid-binding protein YceI
MRNLIWLVAPVLLASALQAQAPANVPVIKITPVKSTIKFAVKASVPIEGTFDKWDATLTYTSAHAEDGVLDIKIQAASVNTGSGMKDGKLKSKDFFNAEQDPYISFHSTKIVQTGPDSFEIPRNIHDSRSFQARNLELHGQGHKRQRSR